MKKFFSCLIIAFVLFTSLPVTALAKEDSKENAKSFDFIPMSMTDYVSNKANSLGISYAEADALVVDSINKTLAEMYPLTRGGTFITSTSEVIDGVRFSTGYIQYLEEIANTNGAIKIKFSVPAVMVEASVGRYLAEVDENQARVYEASSGIYTVAQHTVQASVNLRDSFTVILSAAGNVEITYGKAVELGINMELFGYSDTTSTNVYTRIPFVIGTTYKVTNR